VCSALVPAAIGASACGSAERPGSTSHHSSGAPATGTVGAQSVAIVGSSALDGDGDGDQPGSRHDPDNDKTLSLGQAAGAADRSALAGLVRHYYAVAAAGDGAKACSLLYWPTAELLVEEHEGNNGSPSLRGNTCGQIASKLFARHRHELARQIAALEVTEVQVKGNRGFVRLRFAATPEHVVSVHREGGVWKVSVLLDEVGV
jgi:hypothetical protein